MCTGEQLTDVEVQVELQGDADDAQRTATQGIGVGGAGGDHAQAEAAHQGVGLVGHGQQGTAQAGGHGAVGTGGQILFAQGLGHHRALALAPGVDAAHDALQGVEFAHHAGHQVGLGQTPGAGGVFGAHLAPGHVAGQPAAQGLQTAGLLAHGAQTADEDDVIQLFQPVVEIVAQVGMPEEAGIFQAGTQHAFPAVLDQAHVLGGDVEHGQEVRHEAAVGSLDTEAFLMAFHAGEQHFAGDFQIGRIEVGQQGHGMLGQALHLVQQAVTPQHLAADGGSLGVPAFHDDLAAVGGIGRQAALFLQDGQQVVGMGHAEGSMTVDAVAHGLATGSHGPHGEGHHGIIQQGHDPAQRAGIGQGIAAPAHTLAERQGGDDGGADPGQQVRHGSAADALAHGHIFALFGGDAVHIVHAHAVGAGKAFQGFGGRAVSGKGHTHRRAGHFFLALLLHGVHVLDDDDGTTRRAHGTQGAVFHTGFLQGRGETGGQFGFFAGQKTGRQFFAANFKHKGRHALPRLGVEHRIPQLFTLGHIQFGHACSQSAHTADISGTLRDGDGASSRLKVWEHLRQ